MGLQLCGGFSQPVIQDGALVWPAIDGGCGRGAQLGLSNGLSSYGSCSAGFSQQSCCVVWRVQVVFTPMPSTLMVIRKAGSSRLLVW